ncbi:MAG: DUF1467 family protein [Alphaproteobacteria bacterium]|nr:DUF1467 family protein [Alphaproteobacteria bacterium]
MTQIGFVLGVAIYGIVWFLTLFMVLPFGVQAQDKSGLQGEAKSAPVNAYMGRKLIATTLLAGIFYVGIYFLLTSDILKEILPLADNAFRSN